jgi:hypothetical protein
MASVRRKMIALDCGMKAMSFIARHFKLHLYKYRKKSLERGQRGLLRRFNKCDEGHSGDAPFG